MKNWILILAMFFSLAATAQFTPEENVVNRHMLKASLITPGVEYEMGIGRYSSLNLFAGVNPVFGYNAQDGVMYWINPVGNLQYRFYYNLRRRGLKNKETDNNSGDFLAVHLRAAEQTLLSNTDSAANGHWGAGLVWGMHRTFDNGIYLSGFIGPGLALDYTGEQRWAVFAGLRMGYVFFLKLDQEARYRKLERD